MGQIDAFSPAATAIEPREYQLDAVRDCRQAIADGHRRILLQAGTGSGKTVIASYVMRSAVEKAKYGVFFAHRRELIYQCSDKLTRFGVPHGIIMAGELPLEARYMQIASIQTVQSRVFNRQTEELPPCDLLVIDEAHRSVSDGYLKVIDAYPDAIVLGLTATPIRTDRKGLGDIYTKMVQCPSVSELIRMGFLVPSRVFAPTIPDLEGVSIRMGDYVESELAAAVDRPQFVGDIVEHWGRVAEGRKTVAFASSVRHSMHIAEEFVKAGVRAAHLDGETPKAERDEILRQLSRGELEVVSNCMVLTEGWDQPDVSCCILARPTKSLLMYLQMCGRTLRTWPGKTDSIILDHAGAVYEHGFIDEPIEWSLEKSRPVTQPVQDKRREMMARPITCKKCFTVYVGRRNCPNCGYAEPKRAKHVAFIDKQLGEVDRKSRAATTRPATMEDKRAWYGMLRYYQVEKGLKPGWVAHTYREKFGVWPRGLDSAPLAEPSAEVRAFIRHKNIRYAKRKEAIGADRAQG